MRADLKNILGGVPFFSITMELVYTKVVVRGKAVELLLKCVHMNDIGGTADDLKTAIDALSWKSMGYQIDIYGDSYQYDVMVQV